MKELKTVKLNVEKGKFEVNGENFSDVSVFNLHFENGIFQLEFTENYYATGQKMRPIYKDASITE